MALTAPRKGGGAQHPLNAYTELNISGAFARISVLRLTPTRKEPAAPMGCGPVLDLIRIPFGTPSRARIWVPRRRTLCRCFRNMSSPSRMTSEGSGLFAARGREPATSNKGGAAARLLVACRSLLWNEKVGG
jgi:hypothetical protein